MTECDNLFFEKMKKKDLLEALEADYDFHSVFIHLVENKELEKILADVKNKKHRSALWRARANH